MKPGGGRRPAVSVVLPTYERADVLPRAIDSVLRQTFEDWELLVVDDGSTDGTAAVLERYDDPRVRPLRTSTNAGPAAARNVGLEHATGELIAFLDSDDEWMPGKLERQVAFFRELPDRVGLTYTGGRTVRAGRPAEPFVPTAEGDLHRDLLRRNVIHATPSVVLRREVVERVGRFDESLPAIEDYDYWLRVSAAYEVRFLAEPLVLVHDAPGEHRMSRDVEGNLRARARFYEKHGDEMRRHGVAWEFLLESARRRLTHFHWRPRQARRLLLEALRMRPASPALWGPLLRSFVPGPVYRRLAAARGRLVREVPT